MHRIAPPPLNGVFPFLSEFDPPRDPYSSVRMVSFAYRRQLSSDGGFYDYSARYGAVREEDRVTLRESILKDAGDVRLLEELSKNLELLDKLDLPLVALSNGQTRRASVLRQLLLTPNVLLLDEPLSTCHLRASSPPHAYSHNNASSWPGRTSTTSTLTTPTRPSRPRKPPRRPRFTTARPHPRLGHQRRHSQRRRCTLRSS